jgi:hypothetical protein
MPLGMFPSAVARGVIERGRRRCAAERAVIADIGPDTSGIRFALGQDRHRSVITVEPLSRQDVGFDEGMERSKRRRAGTDLVRQRRHAEVDTLAGEAIALPVQRLMLTELLKQDHRQQVRPGKAARCHMEWRRWLGDGLARPAGEPLTDRLDDLPPARDDFQRFGDVLTQLGQLRRAAARTVCRRWDHHTFARQMFGEWLA